MNSLTLLIIALCVFGLAYRYYGAFLAAKVAVLDPKRTDPRPRAPRRQGLPPHQQVHPLRPPFRGNRGRGAADRAGAGGAIRLPARRDVDSHRRGVRGRGAGLHHPLRERAQPGRVDLQDRASLPGPVAGWCTAFAVLFIIIVALAGLASAVVKALEEQPVGSVHHRLQHPDRVSDGAVDV